MSPLLLRLGTNSRAGVRRPRARSFPPSHPCGTSWVHRALDESLKLQTGFMDAATKCEVCCGVEVVFTVGAVPGLKGQEESSSSPRLVSHPSMHTRTY